MPNDAKIYEHPVLPGSWMVEWGPNLVLFGGENAEQLARKYLQELRDAE